MPKARGPPPGATAGQKRKAEDELSTNPYTKKARDRLAQMTPAEAAVERAKAAKTAAINYALRKLRKTNEYGLADAKTQKEMEQMKRNEVIQKRAEQEEQAKTNENYIPRELQGLGLTSDELEELKWRQEDEKRFGKENMPTKEDSELALEKREVMLKNDQGFNSCIYQTWITFWEKAYAKMKRKMKLYKFQSLDCTVPPEQFFKIHELSLLQTLVLLEKEKYPGHPKWWNDEKWNMGSHNG
ncbi:hypothetical protein AJ78_08937 [Emergomyces pasteurianus Ep9510]|uniref:Uncharacterized protein n=1 Tax=Emergomyces pasteurianus Ep9510 TaxID=1447872 RepID=A0A1J9NYT9_9EURO|nr:hypothetical protein AJ78_08937 [Emergomyces pasteurianus Ep9510]